MLLKFYIASGEHKQYALELFFFFNRMMVKPLQECGDRSEMGAYNAGRKENFIIDIIGT